MPESPSPGTPQSPEEITAPQTSQPGDTPQWAWLARIRRPQGRKGEVFADILTDFPEKFAERRRLWLVPETIKVGRPAGSREVILANHWLHKGGIILHFSGIDSINDAETLAGLIVAIPIAERAPLAEDETYIGDLIGCTLIDVSQTPPAIIGAIQDVDRTAGPVALLVVRAPGSADEVLVPFAKSYLRNVDIAARRVEMALPDGLVDLNASEKP